MVALTHLIAAAEGAPEACRATAADMRRVVIDDGWARSLLACEAANPQEILGMVLYYPSYSSFAGVRGYFVENIAVVEAARGRGVATALFSALSEAARAEGVAKIEWVCERENSARRFYESRLGAVPEEQYMLYAYPIEREAAR